MKTPEKRTSVDITPKPRILRTLGEIPFAPWQCFAELVDNSIDAFMRLEREGHAPADKSIHIRWSGDDVAAKDRVLEIEDMADGMPIKQIADMAKAGYSGNNPVDNLGLFGMGFNIATARLGDKTRVLSTRVGDKTWTGIEIDFEELVKNEEFSAPIVTVEKENFEDHGTRITISNIKPGIYRELISNLGEGSIRRRLENVYTPILSNSDFKISVQNKRLSPRLHCVWSKDRYVTRNGQDIPAVIEIDQDLGEEYFNVERNAYVPDTAGNGDGKNIVRRPRRLKGWIGIQRYSDPNDYGIDFVRNGRKILTSDKTLFFYENPITGTPIIEYPKELASTWGGRIVGEIHVDFLLPTYQKNDFDRNDRSWQETVHAIRGDGPILPKLRRVLEFAEENTSPLGRLMNAYRRQDPGTKNLSVSQSIAREFAARFAKGDSEYQSDEKWWRAAQEADRKAAGEEGEGTPVDEGSAPSDDVDIFLDPTTPIENPVERQVAERQNSSVGDLLPRSQKIDSFSKDYGYGRMSPFSVTVYEVKDGDIWVEGARSPTFFSMDGIRCDYFYNPRHSLFLQYHINFRDPLAIYLADRFRSRDQLPDIGKAFADVVQDNNQDLRMDKTTLQERAGVVFGSMRETMQVALGPIASKVMECVKESTGETEETIQQMLPDSPLIEKFQSDTENAIAVLEFVPNKTLVRLIDRFPEMTLDGKVFNIPYMGISLDDDRSTERLRVEAKDRLLSFLKDAVWVTTLAGAQSSTQKDELVRCLYSINFLEKQVCQ